MLPEVQVYVQPTKPVFRSPEHFVYFRPFFCWSGGVSGSEEVVRKSLQLTRVDIYKTFFQFYAPQTKILEIGTNDLLYRFGVAFNGS